jgi:hypothetical protein
VNFKEYIDWRLSHPAKRDTFGVNRLENMGLFEPSSIKSPLTSAELNDIIGGLFSGLLIELLELRPESRSLASEVVSRLYHMQKGLRDRGLMDPYF